MEQPPTLTRKTWLVHYALQMVLMVGSIYALFQGVMPLRADKMEINYRNEGVQFAAGPQGVPPEKWERMKTTQLEIVEPMANWIVALAAALLLSSTASICVLMRLSKLNSSGE